ncbi:hypothetical protein [Salmonella enterica]|uniref:hypothetical protein n=1 Tax=Salmonella enterica TaxID=28901 RepID=UPI00126709AF|nr:hypothetical protein [Salmonella enterica]
MDKPKGRVSLSHWGIVQQYLFLPGHGYLRASKLMIKKKEGTTPEGIAIPFLAMSAFFACDTMTGSFFRAWTDEKKTLRRLPTTRHSGSF